MPISIRSSCASLLVAATVFGLDTPDLAGIQVFPPDNYWYWDISNYAVHPYSAAYVASVGAGTSLHPDFGTFYQGQPWGIPYIVVDKSQAKVPVNFTDYGDESDPGPYPIPLTAPIEGGNATSGDRHTLAIDKDAKILYELFVAIPRASGWDAASGAKFDLTSNALRQDTWTSADAAGLPILPGLVRYDEVKRGEINHAIRMTVDISQRKYIWPARHQAGSTTSPDRPPMGLRFRLKQGFDISTFPPSAQVVLRALKKHGMIVADNGGNWFITGAPHGSWNDEEINTLKRVKGSDFEAILSVDTEGEPIYPGPGALAIVPMLSRPLGGEPVDLLGRWMPTRRHAAVVTLLRPLR